ncbi:MAG: ABC transporter permease [Proteobacteria bacterium]|nr:ABC transporter permease [Pseudomonadota bacterium]
MFWEILIQAGFWAAAVRIATTYLLGTLGELLCERVGVLNLGIEGIMTVGAMAGWMWAYHTGDLWSAVLFAFFIGCMAGLLHAILTVFLGLSQHVSGIGITLLLSSLSYYVFRMLLPSTTTPPKIMPFDEVEIPLLSDLPVIGEAFFNQSPMTYLAVGITLLFLYVLNRTPLGLALRLVGENPAAADSQGIPVYLVRTGAVMVGSGLMAIGGAFLTLSHFDAFYFGMINGRGWICVALVIFASWRPGKAFWGVILFAAIEAFQLRVKSITGGLPYQFYLMLPYIVSILALVFLAKNAAYPRSLLIPYRRGER